MEEINHITQELQKGAHPVPFKKQLAFAVVKQLHDEKAAEDAQSEFERVVQRNEMPTEIPVVTVKDGENLFELAELLIHTGMAGSRSEAKRLVEQGGVMIDEERQEDPSKEIAIEENIVLKVGKRKFVEVRKG